MDLCALKIIKVWRFMLKFSSLVSDVAVAAIQTLVVYKLEIVKTSQNQLNFVLEKENDGQFHFENKM